MNALKLVKRYARLKSLNNITKLDWFIVILNVFLLIISIKSSFIGIKLVKSLRTWVDGYTPDLYDHIRMYLEGAFDWPALLWGILGILGSLMIIHMVLKK